MNALQNDKLLRPHLLAHLPSALNLCAEDRLLSEFGLELSRRRADVLVVRSHECQGFEIKAEHDTFARLDAQVAAYSEVFDRATLVTVPKHAKAAEARLPAWWGLWVADINMNGVVGFEVRRAGDINPAPSPVAVASTLWKEEALALLEELGHDRGVRTKPKHQMHRRLAEVLPLSDLASRVRQTLLHREKWRWGTQ